MDKTNFIRIAVTVPYFYRGESEDIERILDSGEVDMVHVRKPDASAEDIKSLVCAIAPRLRKQLTLHDHFELADELGAGGVHLNRRNQSPPAGWQGRTSLSAHSIDECRQCKHLDYVTLSPIFPSISKQGYRADFDQAELNEMLSEGGRTKVIALGGVTPDKFKQLEAMGFDGAAMLSAAWSKPVDLDAFRLQFITNPLSVGEAANQVAQAVEGGCRWVQLRWKDADERQLREAAKLCGEICRKAGAVFLVDDHVELAGQCDADGVHLGKNDMAVSAARKILGPGKIIGATANTAADIDHAVAEGADYIGYGPFRYTTTKKNLSPVLGLEGYRRASAHCRSMGYRIPIVAIGGITADDVADIMATGVDGIAVSGVIASSPSPVSATSNLLEIITKHINI